MLLRLSSHALRGTRYARAKARRSLSLPAVSGAFPYSEIWTYGRLRPGMTWDRPVASKVLLLFEHLVGQVCVHPGGRLVPAPPRQALQAA